jgi:hypothetical protein
MRCSFLGARTSTGQSEGVFTPEAEEGMALAYIQACYSSKRSDYTMGLCDEKSVREE